MRPQPYQNKKYISKYLLILLCLWFCPTLYATPKSISYFDSLLKKNNISLQEKKNILNLAIEYATKNKILLSQFDFNLQMAEILFDEGLYFESVKLLESTEKKIETNLLKNKKNSQWRTLHMDVLSQLGRSQAYFGLYEMAMISYKKILDLYGEDTMSLATAKAYNGFGVLLSLRSNYQEAFSYFQKSNQIFLEKKDQKGIFASLSNMGSIHLEMGNNTEALSFFLEAQRFLLSQKQNDSKFTDVNFYIAVAYQKLKKWDLAEKYYMEAKHLASQQNMNHLILYIDENLGNLYYEQGKYDQAKQISLKTLKTAQIMKSADVQIFMANLLGRIADKQGDCNSYSYYLKQELEIREKLSSDESSNKVASMKYEFENYKKMQAGKVKEIELELTKARLIKRNLWIVVLGFIFVLAVFAIALLVKKIYSIKRTMKEKMFDIVEENQSNFEVIEVKNKELASNALLFLKINELNSSLMQKVKELKYQSSLKNSEKKVVNEMESILKQFNPDKSWNEFKIYFEQVNHEFFTKLDVHCPDLTPNEKRLCALIYLNLNAKEIASLTNRTFQSVNTAKYRLKKKLHLAAHVHFPKFLQKLMEN